MGERIIVGCGYLGLRVAKIWAAAGHLVYATTRSADKAQQLDSMGFKPLSGNILSDESPLPPAEVVLYAVGFDRHDPQQTVHDVFVTGLQQTIGRLSSPPKRLIYISTTGVYGQSDAELVTEDAPCEPTRPGGQASLAAEQLLLESAHAPAVIRLRLAGIYGPGRIPFIQKLQAGEEIPVPAAGYLNLIHVTDAAHIVDELAAGAGTTPMLLNVSDGHPVKRADYYGEVARLIGAPPPTLRPPDPSSHVAQRAGNKRIDNRALMKVLQRPLQFPDYRVGLADGLV